MYREKAGVGSDMRAYIHIIYYSHFNRHQSLIQVQRNIIRAIVYQLDFRFAYSRVLRICTKWKYFFRSQSDYVNLGRLHTTLIVDGVCVCLHVCLSVHLFVSPRTYPPTIQAQCGLALLSFILHAKKKRFRPNLLRSLIRDSKDKIYASGNN